MQKARAGWEYFCEKVYSYSDRNPGILTSCKQDTNTIHNDKVIIVKGFEENGYYKQLYGILNLKTGNYDLEISKEFIIYDRDVSYNKGYYIMPHDNEKWYSHSVYDENLNPVFESKNIDAFYVKKIGNSVFADLGDYFTIINNEGKI